MSKLIETTRGPTRQYHYAECECSFSSGFGRNPGRSANSPKLSKSDGKTSRRSSRRGDAETDQPRRCAHHINHALHHDGVAHQGFEWQMDQSSLKPASSSSHSRKQIQHGLSCRTSPTHVQTLSTKQRFRSRKRRQVQETRCLGPEEIELRRRDRARTTRAGQRNE